MKTEHVVAIGVTAAALIGITVMYIKSRQGQPLSPSQTLLQSSTASTNQGTVSTTFPRVNNPTLLPTTSPYREVQGLMGRIARA